MKSDGDAVNPDELKDYLRSLNDRLDKAAGMFTGRTPQEPFAPPFASPADMMAAIADPRYRADAGYRHGVAMRVAAMRGR
jgi:hypothetical protein